MAEQQIVGSPSHEGKHDNDTVNSVDRGLGGSEASLTAPCVNGHSQCTTTSTAAEASSTTDSSQTMERIALLPSSRIQVNEDSPNLGTLVPSPPPKQTESLSIVNPHANKSPVFSAAASPNTSSSLAPTSSESGETGERLAQADSSAQCPSPSTTAASPTKQSPRTSIQNPYAKKRRIDSTNQHGSPQSASPSNQSNQVTSQSPRPLPKGLRSFDKFFTILIRDSPRRSYLDAAKDTAKASKLWERLCKIAKVKQPMQPIDACYDNNDEHFQLRAALVLEETRNEISLQTDMRWQLRDSVIEPKRLDPWLLVVCSRIDGDQSSDVTKVVVYPKGGEPNREKAEFTARERSLLSQGTIVECKTGANDVYWGAVNYTSEAYCVMLFYGSSPPIQEGIECRIRNMGESHIPAFREFLACTHPQTQDIDFLDLLIGKSKPCPKQQEPPREIEWVGPTLNSKQQEVVMDFLTCPSGTLQVVQG